MRKLIIAIVCVLSIGAIYAQQDAMFTHYAFNTMSVNPAYAGSREALTITGLHRDQWVGFEGAPVAQTLTVHTPVFNDKLGLGLSILNDKIGPTNTLSFDFDLSYILSLEDHAKLAFGLKSGVNIMEMNLGGVSTSDIDPVFASDVPTQVLPSFGLGVYYHTPEWYVGASTPNVVENKLSHSNSSSEESKESIHLFLIGGFVFELSQGLKFKPTSHLKVTKGVPIELDVTGMLIVKEKVEVGAMYRTGDALGVLLGYNINNNFRVGYSFDWSFKNTTFKYNAGSHGLMVRHDFIYHSNKKINSPRYF